MKVPSYGAPKVQQASMPGIRANVNAPAEAFGGGQAAKPYEAFGNVAESAANIYQVEKENADSARNKNTDFKFDKYVIGQKSENGYLGKKGEAALNKDELKKMLDGLDAVHEDALKSASNDEQRYYATQAYYKNQASLEALGSDHFMKQKEVFDKENTVAVQKTSKSRAVMAYNIPEEIQKAEENLTNATGSYAKGLGLSEESQSVAINEQVSELHKGVLEKYINNLDTAGAQKYYNANKSKFFGKDIDAVDSMLKSAKLDSSSTALADSIFKKEGYRGEVALNERLSQIGDENLRSATKTKIMVLNENEKKKTENDANQKFISAAEMIEKGGSYTQLPPSYGLTPDEVNVFKERQLQISGAKQVKPKPAKYEEYDSMSQRELGLKSSAQLYGDLRANVTDDQWKRISDKWQVASKANAGDEDAKKQFSGFQQWDDSLFRSMQEFKIEGLDVNTLRADMDTDQKIKFQQFKDAVNDKSLLWSQQNQGKKPDPETIKKITDSVVFGDVKLNVENRFFDSVATITSISPEDRPKAYSKFEDIPEKEVQGMVKFLQVNKQLYNLDYDSALSMINKDSGIGSVYRKRIQKAYAQKLLGDNAAMMQKLKGE
jgi:hypothetical protein